MVDDEDEDGDAPDGGELLLSEKRLDIEGEPFAFDADAVDFARLFFGVLTGTVGVIMSSASSDDDRLGGVSMSAGVVGGRALGVGASGCVPIVGVVSAVQANGSSFSSSSSADGCERAYSSCLRLPDATDAALVVDDIGRVALTATMRLPNIARRRWIRSLTEEQQRDTESGPCQHARMPRNTIHAPARMRLHLL
jgi:hypothetical protein